MGRLESAVHPTARVRPQEAARQIRRKSGAARRSDTCALAGQHVGSELDQLVRINRSVPYQADDRRDVEPQTSRMYVT